MFPLDDSDPDALADENLYESDVQVGQSHDTEYRLVQESGEHREDGSCEELSSPALGRSPHQIRARCDSKAQPTIPFID
jgi:hypothetical protein